MAQVARVGGVLPLLAAFAAATALAGAALLTVSDARCADPGQYVLRDGQVQLLGGCVNPADLPASSHATVQRHEHGTYGEAHW